MRAPGFSSTLAWKYNLQASCEFEPGQRAWKARKENCVLIDKRHVDDYFSLRTIEGITDDWHDKIKRKINDYLEYVNWKVDKAKTLEYLRDLKKDISVCYYRKIVYQIRKFLLYLNVEWAKNIKPPAEPEYTPQLIRQDNIINTLGYFREHPYYKQMRAIVLLGASSGLRAEELYQLTPKDIDLEKRIVYVNHNPDNGQTTKTGKSRIAFFNKEAKEAVIEYIEFFNKKSNLKKIFSLAHIERAFKNAPIKVKDLRKFFSQEWDRRGGATSIKKILMGHSLKGDVDLMHYNCQSEEDLKKIYDKVMEGECST